MGEALMTHATNSAEETREVGRGFASRLKPGDVVLLSGDLGAGKTQFVQGVAAGLGVAETPISPTFNIVLSYGSGRMPLHHFDLYRLDSPQQLEDIGIAEYLESGGVCLVEWAEKFPHAFEPAYRVNIAKTGDSEREIRIEGEMKERGFRAEGRNPFGEKRGPFADARGDDAPSGLAASADSRAVERQSAASAARPSSGAPGSRAKGEKRPAGAQETLAFGESNASASSSDARQAARNTGKGESSRRGSAGGDARFVLAVDTANEVVALGVGELIAEEKRVSMVATREIAAHRASNTTLVPALSQLLDELDIARSQLACLCVGRGPGSFTGVRICMAAAKGMAQALGVGLVGVSTMDAIAWNAQAWGVRGDLLVVADAMRKEVYPVRFSLDEGGVHRLSADRVVKAAAFAEALCGESSAKDTPSASELREGTGSSGLAGVSGMASESVQTMVGSSALPRDVGERSRLQIAGDALVKYRDLYEPAGVLLSDKLWEVTGRGLLLVFQAAWRAGEADPFDALRHDPAFALPVYTRLSDAEENERIRLAKDDAKNLRTGVQDVATVTSAASAASASSAEVVAPDGGKGRATMHSQARLEARANSAGVSFRPLAAHHAAAVAALEARAMGTDAWSERLVADELGQRNRTWWVAEHEGELIGYAGGLVVDGDVQVLKVAVEPAWRRHGIARELLLHVAEDARNLGATTCSLEVRASNAGAQALYEALGLQSVGVRPRYYSDREDAVIMQGPLPGTLPGANRGVAGMELQHLNAAGVRTGDGRRADGGQHADSGQHADTGQHEDDGRHAVCEGGATAGAVPFCLVSDGDAPAVASYGASAFSGDVVGGVSAEKDKQAPLILAIESSCDETAAAVVDGSGALLSDVVASQIDFHARFGGVVPEIASRKHIEAICGVCGEALDSAGIGWHDLDSVAVTYAPGLLGALVVGVAFAKGAAWALDVPFIGVNHLEGHLYANKIGVPASEPFTPPAVVSLVSGGNTMLVHMRDWGDYTVLGETIDDAVGEAFDKVAKALGLGYPGGPVISQQAKRGRADAIAFPRAMMHSHDLRFSLSGLKTAVVNYINGERAAGRDLNVPDIAASFQQAVIDVQVAKAATALEQTGVPTFCLGGGVAANPALRDAYERLCAKRGVRLIMPPLSSCGDNAGMIALVALDRYRAGRFFSLDADAQAHANLAEPY